MRFYVAAGTVLEDAALKTNYKNAREIGVLRIAEDCVFFRSGLKTYYMAYPDVSRYFRRIQTVPAKLCCGKGTFDIENLVLMSGDKEVAQIQMPGEKAGKAAMEELRQRLPGVPDRTLSADESPSVSDGEADVPGAEGAAS